jgi:hypothetical protein
VNEPVVTSEKCCAQICTHPKAIGGCDSICCRHSTGRIRHCRAAGVHQSPTRVNQSPSVSPLYDRARAKRGRRRTPWPSPTCSVSTNSATSREKAEKVVQPLRNRREEQFQHLVQNGNRAAITPLGKELLALAASVLHGEKTMRHRPTRRRRAWDGARPRPLQIRRDVNQHGLLFSD